MVPTKRELIAIALQMSLRELVIDSKMSLDLKTLIRDFSHETLIGQGLLTKQEIEDFQKKQHRNAINEKEAYERKEFERLKKKFEGE